MTYLVEFYIFLAKIQIMELFCLVWKMFGGKEGGFSVSYERFSVSFLFLRFCAAYLPVE